MVDAMEDVVTEQEVLEQPDDVVNGLCQYAARERLES